MSVARFVVIGLILVLLSACGGEPLSKEKQLQADLDQMEKLAEEKNTSDLMAFFHTNFKAEGRWNTKDIQRMLHFRFLKHKNIYIKKIVKNTEWPGDDEAKVTVIAAMAGSPITSLSALSEARAQVMKFEVLMQREEDHFLIRSVQWEHASPTDFF